MASNTSAISVSSIETFTENFNSLGEEITYSEKECNELFERLGDEALKSVQIQISINKIKEECSKLRKEYEEISLIISDGLTELKKTAVQTEEEAASTMDTKSV